MDNKSIESVNTALQKRALGYDSTEVTEEYSDDGSGGIRMLKRKVVQKNVPPDVSALKLLIELSDNQDKIEDLSDEELESEKRRLIKMLMEENYDN